MILGRVTKLDKRNTTTSKKKIKTKNKKKIKKKKLTMTSCQQIMGSSSFF